MMNMCEELIPKTYKEMLQQLEDNYTSIMRENNCTRDEAIKYYYEGYFGQPFPTTPDSAVDGGISDEMKEYLTKHSHSWDNDNMDTCSKCGDKDWMASAYCSEPDIEEK